MNALVSLNKAFGIAILAIVLALSGPASGSAYAAGMGGMGGGMGGQGGGLSGQAGGFGGHPGGVGGHPSFHGHPGFGHPAFVGHPHFHHPGFAHERGVIFVGPGLYYDWPVYPYAGAAAGYWYYCESIGTYYPYASTCPEGWAAVPPG